MNPKCFGYSLFQRVADQGRSGSGIVGLDRHGRALADRNRMAGPSVSHRHQAAGHHQRRVGRIRSARSIRSIPAADVPRHAAGRYVVAKARRRNAPFIGHCKRLVLFDRRRGYIHGLPRRRWSRLAAELRQRSNRRPANDAIVRRRSRRRQRPPVVSDLRDRRRRGIWNPGGRLGRR